MTTKTTDSGSKASVGPKIVKATIDQLTIYEISEAELVFLEKGSPGSIYLNFAIFLISTAVAFTIALYTTTVPPGNLFNMFFLTSLVGYILGALFLILWVVCLISSTSISKLIRKRLPPEGVSQQVAGTMGIESHLTERLEILEAVYGLPGAIVDVSQQVSAMIKDNTLKLIASNEIAGDPAPHQKKKLTIRYRLNEVEYYSEFLEGTEVLLPLKM